MLFLFKSAPFQPQACRGETASIRINEKWFYPESRRLCQNKNKVCFLNLLSTLVTLLNHVASRWHTLYGHEEDPKTVVTMRARINDVWNSMICAASMNIKSIKIAFDIEKFTMDAMKKHDIWKTVVKHWRASVCIMIWLGRPLLE